MLLLSLPLYLYGSASSEVILHYNFTHKQIIVTKRKLLGAGWKINVENNEKLTHRGYTTSKEILEKNTARDFELPFLKFQDILVATNNFSNTFMVGQGGFGKVYKVIILLQMC